MRLLLTRSRAWRERFRRIRKMDRALRGLNCYQRNELLLYFRDQGISNPSPGAKHGHSHRS